MFFAIIESVCIGWVYGKDITAVQRKWGNLRLFLLFLTAEEIVPGLLHTLTIT